jgi:preprotein translocase subunit SecG
MIIPALYLRHLPRSGQKYRRQGACGQGIQRLDKRNQNKWTMPMENVILVIHLLLALGLIGVVLLQRSEGGGLGMGGGGGGGAMTGRSAASALSKLTWILAVAFIITSITMTVIAAQNSAGTSVLDRLGTAPRAVETAPTTGDLLPPVLGDGSITPPAAD